ncbi:MAG: pectate lyase [candidate division KSB1 bacterium]|nr:pectate lyase [candidate division KSB1 bacterium]
MVFNNKLNSPLIAITLVFIGAIILNGQQLSFPGAEGFGQYTSGGRGGRVIEVTNLNASGPGSFRAAAQKVGPRIIVFCISGTIPLESELIIENGDLTIAGQTAPGDGICIKNYQVNINADNVIVRYLRFRPGDEKQKEGDALSAIFQKDIMIDHCSFSWGNDEVATVRDNVNATMQWCMISESLHHSSHHKGDHGYGGIWGGMGASFHHNLLAHHTSRNPRFHGSRYHGKPERELVDFRNNVIYNWGFNSGYGGEQGQQNLVANYYKAGPATKEDSLKFRIVEPWDNLGKWYIADNYIFGFPEITMNNWSGGVQGKNLNSIRVDHSFPAPAIIQQNAEEAFQLVLAQAGATLPKRDAVDRRIVEEVRSGTAQFGGIWGEHTGIIDSQTQVGGWPVLRSKNALADTDHDGMPDVWEQENGLDINNPKDRNGDFNGDGYTNLEKYLNSLVKLK